MIEVFAGASVWRSSENTSAQVCGCPREVALTSDTRLPCVVARRTAPKVNAVEHHYSDTARCGAARARHVLLIIDSLV